MTARPCPICNRPAQTEHAPFCSPRCADVDLQRWFTGRYAVPGVAASEDEGAQADED